ncbi:MAG: Stp1/IreP family PP2C-type Ser/Thr phosphatase [Candidatus Hydrogenedentota bacterium]
MPDSLSINHGPEHGGNFEYEWSSDTFQVHLLSDIGRKREHNEDSCVLCVPNDDDLRQRLGMVVAVADGMGGASAGEHASHLALTSFISQYYGAQKGTSIPVALESAIKQANQTVFQEASDNPEYDGMGTTLSSLVLHGDNAYVGQVGDSRVYKQKPGQELIQITQDHSLVWEQLQAGIISEEEAKNHSMRNLITRAVGIKPDVEVDLFSMKISGGDVLLICSDGLSGLIDDPVIHDGINRDSLQATNRVLVGKALDAGGTDNVTIATVLATSKLPKSDLQAGCDELINEQSGFLARLKQLFS